MGMIQTRTNVPLGLTSQHLLLQAQPRLRTTMQTCLESRGKTRRVNVRTVLPLSGLLVVRPSFDSATLLGASCSVDEIFTCVTRREKDAHARPTSVQKLVKCPVLVSLRIPASPGPRCSIMLCVWLSRHVRVPFIFLLSQKKVLGDNGLL